MKQDNVFKNLMEVFEDANRDIKKFASDIQSKNIELPTEQQLPSIITSQYNSIVELEDSVVKSLNLAKDASSSAKKASEYKVHWYGGRKDAIELLQDSSKYSAEALISLAEAQQKLFEYQTKLTEITKFLFGLGISNIVMNRCVVRELDLKLKGASGEEISELAKQELRNVIRQLKAQEDIHEKIIRHSEVLSKQQQKDVEHDRKFREKDILDKKQDTLIRENIKKISEHETTLGIHSKKDKELEERLNKQNIENEQQNKEIDEHRKILESHSKIDTELKTKIQDVAQNATDMVAALQVDVTQRAEDINNQIITVTNRFEEQINDTQDTIHKANVDFMNEIHNISIEFNNIIDKLKNDINIRDDSIEHRIETLESQINLLNMTVSKKGWKIVISIIASASVVLNILQITGVI